VVAGLRRAFPSETIFTTDGTATEFWLSEPALRIDRPRTFVLPEVSQTMGYGLAAAIGARLAAPDRPVVCATGDGSLTMGMSELVTAAGLGVNLPVVVFDDGYYNALRIYQDGLFGGRRMGVQLNNPDFVKLAEAIGARGIRVEALEELEPALVAAREASGLTLVDVAIDYRPLPTRYANRVKAMTSLEKY
jgi:acetolactate synthase-1/2/3 large subunit